MRLRLHTIGRRRGSSLSRVYAGSRPRRTFLSGGFAAGVCNKIEALVLNSGAAPDVPSRPGSRGVAKAHDAVIPASAAPNVADDERRTATARSGVRELVFKLATGGAQSAPAKST